ncbi:MAG: hypothetical protein K8R88_09155 [Armatimonadetes bacterium]|nr:hypothetical protein [Armatimonadota bacterium]
MEVSPKVLKIFVLGFIGFFGVLGLLGSYLMAGGRALAKDGAVVIGDCMLAGNYDHALRSKVASSKVVEKLEEADRKYGKAKSYRVTKILCQILGTPAPVHMQIVRASGTRQTVTITFHRRGAISVSISETSL